MTSTGGFAGLHEGCQDYIATCTEPPDPWVAVGTNDVLQIVNEAVRISKRSGTTLATIPFTSFFNWPGGNIFDPRALWDQAQGRWIASALSFDCHNGQLHLAVSAGADPMGTWKLYTITFPEGVMGDYDGLGLSSDKVVISVMHFGLEVGGCAETGIYGGASLDIVDWSDLLAGSPLNYSETTPDPALFDWRPATALSSTSTLPAVVEIEGTTSDVGYATISGTNTAGTVVVSGVADLTSAGIVSGFFSTPPPAGFVSGGSSAEDGRIKDAIWQNGKLWFISTSACTPTGDAVARDCVRVTALDTTTATPTLSQDFLLGSKGYDFFMGGIGLSRSGVLNMVFTVSSASSFLSTYATVQTPNDPINTYAPLTLLKAGQSLYSGQGFGRWGDYVGVAQDPTNPDAVWQGDEYPNATGQWSTWISQLVSDTTAPVGTFTINAGATTSADPIVSIADPATDNLTGVSLMAVSNNGTAWRTLPYASSFTWDTTNPTYGGVSGLGTKTVSLRWQDGAGNWSGVVAHSIELVAGNSYVSVGPVRIVDSRKNQGLTTLHAGVSQSFQVSGLAGVPANAVAVTGNLTVTNQTAGGAFALTSVATNSPTTSSLNFPIGDNRATGVTAPLSATGKIYAVYIAPASASTGLVFDVTGYFSPVTSGATYHALALARVLDTRFNTGLGNPFVNGIPREFAVAGHGGVPGGAIAVTGNLTVTRQTASGYIALTTTAQAKPATSTLNFPLADDRANGVTVPLTADGQLWATYVGTGSASTALIFDVTGYFLHGPGGDTYVSLSPTRLVDSRIPRGLSLLHTNLAQSLQVSGVGLIPTGALALTGNLAVTGQTAGGYVALTPVATNNPTTSTLNFPLGDTRSNGITVPLGPTGSLSATYVARAGATTQVILDATGYFIAP